MYTPSQYQNNKPHTKSEKAYTDITDIYLYGYRDGSESNREPMEVKRGEEHLHIYFVQKDGFKVTNDLNLAVKLFEQQWVNSWLVQQFKPPVKEHKLSIERIQKACWNFRWFGEWHYKVGKSPDDRSEEVIGADEHLLRFIGDTYGYTEAFMADYPVTRKWKEDADKRAGPAAAINSAVGGTSVQSLMRLSDNTIVDPIVDGKGKAPAPHQGD